ncbi:MAG: hypothetical protein OEZ01_00725 [Candidatus Heimdallarchaeota archaeon]|nr:hypothetical protein [Candidatus Heimdallarchaeota archaeon]MDH5644496.1 hypothetical protein [Candidatus Heimdallarchaeota archaeon]
MALTTGEKILAPLTFKGDSLKQIGNDDGSTGLGMIIFIITSILTGLSFSEDLGDTALQRIVVGIAFQFLFLLFFSFLVNMFLKMFGGKSSTTMGVVRIFCFAYVWNIVGSIFALIGLSQISNIIFLCFFITLLLGLSSFTGVSIIAAFMALLLAFAITVIILFIIWLFLIVAIIALIFA